MDSPVLEQATPPRQLHWFTKDNARQMSAKAHEALKLRREQIRQALNPIPAKTDETYIQHRLARTREQIERVANHLEHSLSDAGQVDRYASAIAKLSEIERQLAGRPMPGSLKPSQPKPKSKPSTSTVQLVPEPEPEASPPQVHHTEGTPEPRHTLNTEIGYLTI